MDFFRRIEFSGFADMYYGYNFNTPKAACATIGGVDIFNCLRNFDVAHNSFSLSLAEFAVEKKPTADSRAGFRLDFDYGATSGIVAGFEPGGTTLYQNIQQAYVSYLAPTGTGLQFDFGKFVTPAGFEVIETKDNWNYSRSLLFALAVPYYHTGMRVTYSPTDKITTAGFLVNGWNNSVDNNTGKTIGASITVKPTPELTIIENYLGGPEAADQPEGSNWRHLSDTIVTYAATKKVNLAVNFDYGQDKAGGSTAKWWGIALYGKLMPNDWFAVTPRYEYYDDMDGFSTGAIQKVQEVTITTEFKHKDGFMTRAEYRHDFSDVAYFTRSETDAAGTVTNSLKKNQGTFTIGFVYSFSTKAQ
jgi:hypothetical protein